MYGLIFENFSGYIKVTRPDLSPPRRQVKYGEEAWENVRRMANVDTPTFSIHQVPPGSLV
jgi:guanylate cyclase